MNLHRKIIEQSIAYPRQVIWTIVLVSLALAACMVWIKVDTDPENMLAEDEPVRLFHTAQKTEFALYDMVMIKDNHLALNKDAGITPAAAVHA